MMRYKWSSSCMHAAHVKSDEGKEGTTQVKPMGTPDMTDLEGVVERHYSRAFSCRQHVTLCMDMLHLVLHDHGLLDHTLHCKNAFRRLFTHQSHLRSGVPHGEVQLVGTTPKDSRTSPNAPRPITARLSKSEGDIRFRDERMAARSADRWALSISSFSAGVRSSDASLASSSFFLGHHHTSTRHAHQ